MANVFKGFTFRDGSDKSQHIAERDMRALSPSYTRSYGFVMDRGQGSEVWDVEGNRYIDFAAGIAVLSTGHCHPKIVEAINAQAQKYIHIGATDFFCPSQLALGERLQQISPINGAQPADVMTYFGNSGAEAVEAALKLARYQPGNRHHVIAFYGAFHGRTMGALSVTASKYIQRKGYPHIPGGVDHVPYPAKSACRGGGAACSQCWCDAVGFIEEFIIKRKVPADEIAAIIVEPIQGEGGYLLPQDDFLPRLRQLCDQHGILLISDEIQAGMGRTGKWFAMENWDVKPDIIVSAKGLGSGMPIGATITRREIMEAWVPGAHASTFGGNPLACAVAVATIDVLENEGLLESATRLGEYTMNRLNEFKQDHPSVARVEGKGLMIGVEFTDPHGQPIPQFRDEVANRAFLKGLISLGAGASTMRIAPPLVITESLMREGLDILESCIAELEEEMWDDIAG
ncbi:MAG: aminotransferase class III-fold pyridoxal phosphate-dependent enzyme [Anaerolineaceae bacterium]|nr:MAG: aminotransferase class III-fold pyridoxal phosphate-dependent enzyme [Anaerolineaceae bacterium]